MQNLNKKNMKWWVSRVSISMLFLLIGIFAYMKMDFIVHGVEIFANVENTESPSIVQIKGNAKNAVYISLNGREIYIDKDGSFTEPVALLPGLSVVTLDAQDKFGKSSEKKFEVMYKESTGIAVANEIINTN